MTKFNTITEATEYITTALGEFASDYDIETMASEQTEWQDGKLTFTFEDDEFYTIAAQYENSGDWQGEGWYAINYSDAGQDWTSDGAIWIESEQQLEDELAAAREDETDTHLAYCEYLGDNDEPSEVE